ncbi:MAG: DEAD/DEAH box helicase family protein, partial [Planctomycetes bacterium]|nr:DEAD/DEAH box helicase family protein [Planctomycetota bacterium]
MTEQIEHNYPMELPAGWTAREEQRRVFQEAAHHFLNPDEDERKRVVIIQAPTGMGKSGVAYALLRLLGSGVVVTATKQLQEQYRGDFPDMPRLVGRGNFDCNMGSYSCEKGYYIRAGEKRSRSYCQDCGYKAHVDAAFSALQYVCNYASYVHTSQADPSQREVVIFDEGHRVESEIMSSVSIEITQDWITRTDASFPDSSEEDDLFDWIEDWKDNELKDYYSLEHAAERDRIRSAISYMLKTRDKLRWVAQGNVQGMGKDWVSFKPLRLSRYLSESVLNRTPRIVILSATILDPAELAKSLCLLDSEWAYVESTHSFDPKTRPVVFLDGSLPVVRSSMDDAKGFLLDAIQTIMEEHPDEKGLI